MNKKTKFCYDIEHIENYNLAKEDNFIGWVIHHRLETHNSDGKRRLVNLSKNELIALNMYYNRPASELIFMKNKDHMSLHNKGKVTNKNTKVKMSIAKKGMLFSEEHCLNLSKSKMGHISENGKRLKIIVKDNENIYEYNYTSLKLAAEGISNIIKRNISRKFLRSKINKEFTLVIKNGKTLIFKIEEITN